MDREQSPLEKTSHRTVLCRSCGAEYPADSASGPYCGTMNLPAAETEYLDRLEGIRDNLEELGSLTDRKAKSHLRKLQRNLLIGAVILALLITTAVIVRTNSEKAEAEKEKNEYLWQREAFQRLDEAYEAGDYDLLAAMYAEASKAGHRVHSYKHARFCDALMELAAAAEAQQEYETHGDPNWLPWLFRDEISLLTFESRPNLSVEELDVLIVKRAPLLVDFENRFPISEEEKDAFLQKLKKDGFVPIAECEKFLKEKGMLE